MAGCCPRALFCLGFYGKISRTPPRRRGVRTLGRGRRRLSRACGHVVLEEGMAVRAVDYCSSVYKRYASAQSRLGKNETKLMSKYEMYSFIFMVLGLAVMLFSYIDAIPVSASNTTIAFYMSIFMLMLFRPTLQKWIEYQKSTNAIEYIEFIKQPRRKQNSVRKINAKSVESIQLKDISVSFGNLKIFENINITIQPGVTVGIKGVNGAGKTKIGRAHV